MMTLRHQELQQVWGKPLFHCRQHSGGVYVLNWASLVAQMVKNLPVMWETQVWSLDWEDPLEKETQRTPKFSPGESHGQECLAGNSPWGHKESDTAEGLTYAVNTAPCIWLSGTIPIVVGFSWGLLITGTPLQYSCLANPMDGGAW